MTNYKVNVVSFQVVREPGTEPRPALPSPAATAELARALIPDDAREHFGVLLLDAQHQLVAYHEVSIGTLNASLVLPREVFGPALRTMGVAAVILAHNHPSGNTTPSQSDLILTRRLADAGRLLDIAVLDHVIIGNGSSIFVSLAECGLLG